MLWNDLSRRMPALLITMSIRPKASIAALTTVSPSSAEALTPTALPPDFLISLTTSSGLTRSLTTTAAPYFAKASE